MAGLGCAYGPTTNTTVTVYRTGPDRYAVAEPDWEVADLHGDAAIGEPLGRICCDVWAYAAADRDGWAARPAALDPEERIGSREPDVMFVDVTPGRYRFTCSTMVRDFEERPGPMVYATFELADTPVEA